MTWPNEVLIDTTVRYILDLGNTLMVFENVPARVNTETGEQFFSPETVRQIQQLAASSTQPDHTILAAVYQFAA